MILKQRGARFLFLSPHFPDLNPIEVTRAKLKAHLRHIGARTIDDLWKAIGSTCNSTLQTSAGNTSMRSVMHRIERSML